MRKIIEKVREPLPEQREDGSLVFPANGFEGADIYRARAGRAKQRADYYCQYVLNNINTDAPDLSRKGNLELFVAWSAFSCEIYFKCLLFHINAEDYNDKYPNGKKKLLEHDLKKLYKKLVKSDSNQELNYAACISKEINDFDSQLKEVSDYFNKYRYDFELDIETLNYSFIFALMKKLYAITEQIQFVECIEVYQDTDDYLVIN